MRKHRPKEEEAGAEVRLRRAIHPDHRPIQLLSNAGGSSTARTVHSATGPMLEVVKEERICFRSEIVLNDKAGELIGDILRNGLSAMPKFELNADQVSDIAAFIHSFRVGGYDVSRFRPDTIVVGDPKAGEAYFKAKCASCHDVSGDLKGFAARIDDQRVMQQTWLMPGARGTRPSKPPATTVVVSLASGQQLEGQLIRIDDFIVTLRAADATEYTIRRQGQTPKVEVRDPLWQHKDLLRIYTDKDIHNVTAYLESVK